MKIDLAKAKEQIHDLEIRMYKLPRERRLLRDIIIIPVQTIRDLMEREGTPSLLQNQGLTNKNCVYNANSSYLKCTVHPSGSCEGCKKFEFSPKTSQSF
jgi:hypothetical protein